jgi:phospho-N-acetylmuramoyl-pentapeptide-transferase
MLYWLFLPLAPYFQGFNLFRYISFRAAFAAILAFFVVVVCGPGITAWLREKKLHGCVSHDSQVLKELRQSKQSTPTMGGLVILLAVSLSTLLLGRLDVLYVVVVLFAFVAFGVLGMLDDWAKLNGKAGGGLSERTKLMGQMAIAGAALLVFYVSANASTGEEFLRGPRMEASPYVQYPSVEVADASPGAHAFHGRTEIGPTEVIAPQANHRTDLQLPFFKHFCLDLGILFLFWSALVVVGSTNAVNLTDGLDGLATGCTAVVAIAFCAIAYVVGRADMSEFLFVFHVPGAGELVVFCAAMAGASLGFLWFNSFPATVFMGDTGSLALGGGIGLTAVATRSEFALLVAGGVFVTEAASVILQRRFFKLTGGRRLFRCAPLHHHFQFGEMHEAKVTVRFWIVTVLLALFSLALFKLR